VGGLAAAFFFFFLIGVFFFFGVPSSSELSFPWVGRDQLHLLDALSYITKVRLYIVKVRLHRLQLWTEWYLFLDLFLGAAV